MSHRSAGHLWAIPVLSLALGGLCVGAPPAMAQEGAAAQPGTTASATVGGFSDRLASTDTGGLETRSAALILSGQEGGEVPLAMVAVPRSPEASAVPGVDVWCTVAASDLLAGWPEGEDLLVEVYAYALDGDDGVVQHSSRAFHLSQDNHGAALATGEAVHVATHLPLPPGDYSLRLLLLLRQTGRLGLRVQGLTVPPAESAAETIAAPAPQVLFLQPARGLLVTDDRAASVPGVVQMAGQSWMPQEWPDLGVVDRLFLRSSAMPEQVQILIQEQNGTLLRRLTATPRPLAGQTGASTLAEVVLEPTGLPAGQYLLALEGMAGTPRGGLGIRIGLSAGSAEATPAAISSEASRPSQRRSGPQGLAAEYWRVLQRLASPQEARRGALGALVALEEGAMGDGSAKLQARVMSAELSVANHLAGRQASLLEPLVVLHEEAYRHYRRRGRLLLATHSRKLTARLLELYDEHQAAAVVKPLRAEIFTSQAAFLLELGSSLAARNALSVALENDPQLAPALHLQAAIMEALGEYQRAVELLRRLQDARPADPEAADSFDGAARLRLAINLRRLGKEEQAETLLQQLIERPQNDWVTTVAFQELAALLAAAGRHGEALEALRRGVERLPEAARLVIQMASILDAQGRPAEARRRVASIDWVAQRHRDTPRFLYSQWPIDQVAGVRRNLQRRQLAVLPDLQRLLQDPGEPQVTP